MRLCLVVLSTILWLGCEAGENPLASAGSVEGTTSTSTGGGSTVHMASSSETSAGASTGFTGSTGTGASDATTTGGLETFGCLAERSEVDREDDLQVDYQVHVVYAIPQDGEDAALDLDCSLFDSVLASTTWFAEQTGGRKLRYDTYLGDLDVTFARLSQTDAEIAASGAYVRNVLEDELFALGFMDPRKLYAVYYDGTSTYACGGGAWPPHLPGQVAAMYLKAELPGYPPCNGEGFAAPGEPPTYVDIAMVHEIMHTLGAVAICAPNHVLDGHASDSPEDLLYSGPEAWHPAHVDIGHDDYFDHDDPDCIDIADSAFITPRPKSPELPPLWP